MLVWHSPQRSGAPQQPLQRFTTRETPDARFSGNSLHQGGKPISQTKALGGMLAQLRQFVGKFSRRSLRRADAECRVAMGNGSGAWLTKLAGDLFRRSWPVR
jgi:hypothetical protein